jgi:hypothetical protein
MQITFQDMVKEITLLMSFFSLSHKAMHLCTRDATTVSMTAVDLISMLMNPISLGKATLVALVVLEEVAAHLHSLPMTPTRPHHSIHTS